MSQGLKWQMDDWPFTAVVESRSSAFHLHFIAVKATVTGKNGEEKDT